MVLKRPPPGLLRTRAGGGTCIPQPLARAPSVVAGKGTFAPGHRGAAVTTWRDETVVVHAPERRLHLVHGERSRVALDRGRDRLARARARLGRSGASDGAGDPPSP